MSALVLTLSDDPAESAAAVDRLRADARVALGPPAGARYPVVTTTRTAEEGAQLAEGLLEITGVRLVDVIFADFSDEGE